MLDLLDASWAIGPISDGEFTVSLGESATAGIVWKVGWFAIYACHSHHQVIESLLHTINPRSGARRSRIQNHYSELPYFVIIYVTHTSDWRLEVLRLCCPSAPHVLDPVLKQNQLTLEMKEHIRLIVLEHLSNQLNVHVLHVDLLS